MISNLYTSLICVITIFARAGQPLKCWTCSSIYEPGCGDPFKPEDKLKGTKYFLLECDAMSNMNGSLELQNLVEHVFGPDAQEYCQKTVRKVYDLTVVTRGCALGDVSERSKNCSTFEDEFCKSEVCLEDGCNSAARLGHFLLFIPILHSLLF